MLNLSQLKTLKIMATNLVDILKGYITPDVIAHASSMLGESESGISKTISASIPILLSGLVRKSDNSSVIDGVMKLVNDNAGNSSGVLSNLSSLLTGSGNASTLGEGSKLLMLLFGDSQPEIANSLATSTGVKSSSVLSILGMLAPMLLAYLGKSGISLASLKNMLLTQKDDILSAVPSGLNLGFAKNVDNIGHVKSHLTEPKTTSRNWLLPILLIGAGLVLLYFLVKGCDNKVDTTVATDKMDSISEGAGNMMDTAMVKVDNATAKLGNFFKFKLPNGVELNAPEYGIENKLNTWLMDDTKVVDKTTWFNFDRLLFATGESTLLPESQEQLQNMVAILKAYPSVELKIGGYTDNVGDPAFNQKLSKDRAISVMKEMVGMGIVANRLSAEGYGQQFPVASNDTEDGRAENRRIAVRVTKK